MHLNLVEAALGAAAALVASVAALGLMADFPHETLPLAETVEVDAPAFAFPLPGQFLVGGRPVAAPMEQAKAGRFRIMKFQVSLAEYGRCVAAGACRPAAAAPGDRDVPATGVSYLDAGAFAAWYSGVTGETWRLPTALEAAAAAGERFAGDAFAAAADDPANPAVAWIRRYQQEAAAKRPADPQPKPRGFYGPNARGVEDVGGNVWEWTSTCYVRTTLAEDRGTVVHATENCGVRVLEGRHRAYMTNFVRDGKSGGCAVGVPPENLGFRLVHEDRTFPTVAWIAARLKALGRRT